MVFRFLITGISKYFRLLISFFSWYRSVRWLQFKSHFQFCFPNSGQWMDQQKLFQCEICPVDVKRDIFRIVRDLSQKINQKIERRYSLLHRKIGQGLEANFLIKERRGIYIAFYQKICLIFSSTSLIIYKAVCKGILNCGLNLFIFLSTSQQYRFGLLCPSRS